MDNLGLTHSERYSEKLDPSYFRIDERTLVDFIDFISKFSDQLNFYNIENDIDGTAKSITASDTTILLLKISSFNDKKIKRQLQHALRLAKTEPIQLLTAISYLYSLIEQINDWKNATSDLKDFNSEIDKLIQSKFITSLAKIQQFEKDVCLKMNLPVSTTFYKFSTNPIWNTFGYSTDSHEFSSDEEREIIIESTNVIFNIFNSITSSISMVVSSSLSYLTEIKTAGQTQPHIALFIAFIKMYEHAQNDINKFTGRHLEYYYKDILHFENIAEVPDKVNLSFTLQDGVDTYKIPKNTGLYAGQDKNGRDLVYTIDDELVVSTAVIDNISTIVNDENTSEETHKLFNHVFLDHNINSQVHKEDNKETAIGEIGFALASSFLKLSEGDRTITFTFQLQRQAFEKFLKLYETDIKADVNINIYDINDFAGELFSFAYTTLNKNEETELFVLPQKNIKTHFVKNTAGQPLNKFVVEVEISAVYPPISASLLDEFVAAKERELPLCYFFLESGKMNFYNFYKQIIIEKAEISLHVEGVRDLKVQNQYGGLDPESPFEPFGATPAIGSSFYLGHETIFSQKIDALQIVMDWKDVPLDDNGFAEYYQGYDGIENNQAFKASVSALKDRKWIPAENKQVVPLFDDVPIDDLDDKSIMPVSNIRVIDNLDLNKINDPFKGVSKVNVNDEYSRISTNGFLKFSFLHPATGFGNLEYPKIISKQALRNAKKGSAGEEPINEPWVPTLNSISINFESSLIIDFNNQERYNKTYFYHIKPFGSQLVSEPVGNEISIVPQYEKGTEMYIALDNFNENEILTLFINIDNLVSSSKEMTEVSWSFLMHDTWNEIFDKSILSDTTNNLSTSGIITFDFGEYDKEFFNRKNLTKKQSFPEGFVYLRLKTNTGEGFINRINHVKCHGASATFFNNENVHESLDSGLPPGTITVFTQDHPDIKEIDQPFASFGGAREETEVDFRTRISERLRHKDRCITKWDIEHIVLQEFKEVSKVICLNNTNEAVENEPGSVLVVIIPNIDSSTNHKVLQPRSSEITLNTINEFLSDRISPFVDLTIRNPIYEQVQVKFQIEFREGYNPRYYLQVVNQELREFLNPWLHEDSNVDVTASDNIYSVHIVYFLEKREYVDYVSNVSVFHIINGTIVNLDNAHDNNVVLKPMTAISIFVSAPEHIIEVIGGDAVQDSLGTLAVGKDFSTEYIAEKVIVEGVGKSEIEVDFEVETKREIIAEETDYTLTFEM